MPEELLGRATFSPLLFAAATVERLLCHLAQLLDAGLCAPNAALADLGMLDEGKRRRLLVDWNDTAPGRGRRLVVRNGKAPARTAVLGSRAVDEAPRD